MKFWKQAILTVFCFAATAGTILYTSCTKDNCLNVVCSNGGTCAAGECACPSGFEGTTCNARIISRYLGMYIGYIAVNALPQVLDTVNVYPTSDSMSVYVVDYFYKSDTMKATSVTTTPSSFTINLPLDSNATRKIYASATLNGANTELTLITKTTDTANVVLNSSIFVGSK